jgi:hypothetical protein
MDPNQYLGSKISLISKSDVRYEGILYAINPKESTVYLQNGMSPTNQPTNYMMLQEPLHLLPRLLYQMID